MVRGSAIGRSIHMICQPEAFRDITYGVLGAFGCGRDTSPTAPRVPGAIFWKGAGLAPGWEASLEALVASDIKPHLGPAKALRGVFLGDEICCMNTSCWDTTLRPVTEKLRLLLGPSALLYTVPTLASHSILLLSLSVSVSACLCLCL